MEIGRPVPARAIAVPFVPPSPSRTWSDSPAHRAVAPPRGPQSFTTAAPRSSSTWSCVTAGAGRSPTWTRPISRSPRTACLRRSAASAACRAAAASASASRGGRRDTTSVIRGPAVRRTRPRSPRKRRPRSSSIASLPRRCGSRSARRSTTCRRPASRKFASACSRPSRRAGAAALHDRRVVVRNAVARVLPGSSSDQDRLEHADELRKQRRTGETQNATSRRRPVRERRDAGARRRGDRRA